jgi:hypothetical protein
MTNQSPSKTTYDYRSATRSILGHLRRERDRQIIAGRFGFGLAKRQTLEKIGNDFNITRERVRQIEKAAVAKLRSLDTPELTRANEVITDAVKATGGVALISDIAVMLGAPENDAAYIVFLTRLCHGVELIDEDDDLRASAGLMPVYNRSQVTQLISEIIATIKAHGKPVTTAKLRTKLPSELEASTLEQLMRVSKQLASFEGKWGLVSWPEVNPKSIRDKTYLVLARHGRPLHFTDIAVHVRGLGSNKRNVTVQAVHNELIKDERFILIGRGIYALAEWGYTPGTVAEIISSVLREEQGPLHKDEIVRRVLMKRQVKTTTIILNLQEKDQFVRTAKATYALKENKEK